MQRNQDNEAALFSNEERKFISRTLICKYTQRTLDYKSIFGVLVFPDPSYLIDLTLTNLNCLYGEKLKLSFALTCFSVYSCPGIVLPKVFLAIGSPNNETLFPTKICDFS